MKIALCACPLLPSTTTATSWRKARNTFTVMWSTATLHYQMEFLHLGLSLHHLGNDFTKRHLNIFHVRALTLMRELYMKSLCSPCCVPGPSPCTSPMRCRACISTCPVRLGVCIALSDITGFGESGELGNESQSEEKYPLEERRGKRNIVRLWKTSKLFGVLHQEGESGSPPPVEPRFKRDVCAPVAPTGGRSPPLASDAVTAVEPSDEFGGLLNEQSGTVSLAGHPCAQTANSLSLLFRLEFQAHVFQRSAGRTWLCFQISHQNCGTSVT